jgi:hypothetical protein
MRVVCASLLLVGLLALAPSVQAQCKVCDRCNTDKLVTIIAGLLKEVPSDTASTGTIGGIGSFSTYGEAKINRLRREAKEKEAEADRLVQREQLLEEAKKVLRDCQ